MPESSAEQFQKTPVNLIPERLIRVLHVDDDDDFLMSSKRILEMQDSFQIETALSVKEALQKLRQKPYDVIVSDYQMPETDGLNFLKELRDTGNDVPFILFTGRGREEIAIEALNLGADRYFNKSGKPQTVYGELAHSIVTSVKAKWAEKALQESEEKYRKQFEEAMDAIVLVNAETGIILDCNLAATKLVGRKKSEIIGAHQRILHPAEELDGKFSRTFRQHITEKEGDVLEAQVITKSGEIKYVEIKANLFELGDKSVVQGAFRDITNKKKMEKQLRRERETLELVTGNIGAGLTIISKDYKILWANKFLKTFFGAVKGKTCYSIYNDRTSICPGCGVKEIFETGKKHVVHEQSVPSPDGQRFWVEITANPIRDEIGNIVAASEISISVNDRKQLENKLREAEKRYHALFNKAPLGILIIDSTGTAVEFNEEAHHQLGYSRKEFENLTVFDYEVLETSSETKARMKNILMIGKDEFETKHCTKTGEIRDIKNTVQVIELSGKKFFHVITRDITEQKKAEEALRGSEKRFRELSKLLPEVVFETDATGLLTFVNQDAFERFGYSPEDFDKGLNALQMLTPEDRKKGKENIGRILRGEKLGPSEYMGMKKDGSTFPFIINSIPIIHGNKPVGMRGVIVDITDLKKAEEKLRNSEEKYRELLNGMNDTAWVIDSDCNIIDVNDAAVEVMGYSREEFRSMGLTGIDSNLDPEEIKGLVESMPADEIQVFETLHTTKDGKKIPVEISSSFVTYRGNRSILSIARDITERKKAEEKLDEMMNELVTINEKLGVVGNLTRHDARNKLSVIANNVYLAKQKLAANHGASKYLGDIESAIDHIAEIFDFTKTYEMLGVEELSYMNVEKSVNEAAMLFSGLKGAKLVNECQGLMVMADSLLRQLFYNFIDDTLKYGEKVSQIRVYYTEGEDQLKLIFEDDGVGIPNDEKELIFNEGYGKGTGYGLYLIKKICETYGWTIQETGVPGKGAKFTLTIPKTDKKGKQFYRFDNN